MTHLTHKNVTLVYKAHEENASKYFKMKDAYLTYITTIRSCWENLFLYFHFPKIIEDL